ncbi:MAG: DUF305 domain-containing protein [Halanaerobium sp.]
MKRNLIITLVILAVIGLGVNFAFVQPGPGMMESVDSEYEFLVKMIPHHEEAVANAKILRDNTNREEMREFAKDIIKVQNQEIKEMEKYLAEHRSVDLLARSIRDSQRQEIFMMRDWLDKWYNLTDHNFQIGGISMKSCGN